MPEEQSFLPLTSPARPRFKLDLTGRRCAGPWKLAGEASHVGCRPGSGRRFGLAPYTGATPAKVFMIATSCVCIARSLRALLSLFRLRLAGATPEPALRSRSPAPAPRLFHGVVRRSKELRLTLRARLARTRSRACCLCSIRHQTTGSRAIPAMTGQTPRQFGGIVVGAQRSKPSSGGHRAYRRKPAADAGVEPGEPHYQDRSHRRPVGMRGDRQTAARALPALRYPNDRTQRALAALRPHH